MHRLSYHKLYRFGICTNMHIPVIVSIYLYKMFILYLLHNLVLLFDFFLLSSKVSGPVVGQKTGSGDLYLDRTKGDL